MKSLESFVTESAKKSKVGKYFKNTVLWNGAPDSIDDIESWFLGYFSTCNSAIGPIRAIGNAINHAYEFIDKGLEKFPDDEEAKKYKENLEKLQKLIEDNFKNNK